MLFIPLSLCCLFSVLALISHLLLGWVLDNPIRGTSPDFVIYASSFLELWFHIAIIAAVACLGIAILHQAIGGDINAL